MADTPEQPPVTPPPGADVMERILWEYFRAKIQQQHIMNYHGANTAYVGAAHRAGLLKLSEDQQSKVQPFPASTSNVTINDGGTSEVLREQLEKASQRAADLEQQFQQERAQARQQQAASVNGAARTPMWQLAATALGGSAVTAGLIGATSWLSQPPKPEPKPDPPPVVAPSDGNVGFEVEGIPGGFRNE